MLVLSRKKGEAIRIGDDVVITILESDTGRVKVGIDAPPEVKVLRAELKTRPDWVGHEETA
tara:strand:+ start:989 stop:1171 length:183 start_codon:yes stop_codon:yes gene_type:complete